MDRAQPHEKVSEKCVQKYYKNKDYSQMAKGMRLKSFVENNTYIDFILR